MGCGLRGLRRCTILSLASHRVPELRCARDIGQGEPKVESFANIVRRCFEEVARKEAAERAREFGFTDLLVAGCGTVIIVLVVVHVIISVGLPNAVALSLLIAGPAVSVKNELRIRNRVNQGVAAYQRGDADAVSAVHRYALVLLRKRVDAHRRRTLGPDSDWGRARVPLAEAVDEAEGRVAYWDERSCGDPANEMAPLQFETARRLQEKLRSALDEVDARARVLRQFYHRCEAKLVVMDRSATDFVEVKRLEALSGRADAAVAHAQGAVEALAGQFLAEAQTIADALGSADRTQLRVLAGDAPLDNIEYLADKIHESSERDRSAIATLEKMLETQRGEPDLPSTPPATALP